MIGKLVASLFGPRSDAPSPLNYDDMLILDAEELAEGGIKRAYDNDIVPVLKNHIPAPAEVSEELQHGEFYAVTCNGQRYDIYSPDDAEESWGKATYALFALVNAQLAAAPVKFYAINGGNELGGMFLTQEAYGAACKALKASDRPYLPKQGGRA